MPRRFWESVKQGIVWLGIGVGIVVGLFALADRFDLSRLEIIVTLGFIGLLLLGYAQTKLLGEIHSHVRPKQEPSGNPSSQGHKVQPKPPEKPTGSGAVGGGCYRWYYRDNTCPRCWHGYRWFAWCSYWKQSRV